MADGIVRVLVVDDSALVRKLLTAILSDDPAIQVVGTAADPFEAREKIKALSPDVVTLDVEMPKMDGLTFLRNLMRLRPMPVVMVSSLTEASADITIAALEAGAIDYVSKPKLGVAEGLAEMAGELCEKVKTAARAKVRPRETPHADVRKALESVQLQTTDRIIAIGASTGGTEAVADIMAELPPDCPAVLITQHIPEVFSTRFATRLGRISALSVSEAEDGAAVLLGHAYVAPGDYHLRLVRSGAKYYCRVTHDDTINRHRPAVDALFESVASEAGRNSIGVLLTGMGADGADGLLTMRKSGAVTIAQDRETSVVWGMPGEAIKRGAACETLPLGRIAQRLQTWARG
ncbi:MAG TPA: chemotaxis response regulator protein-glutamate methylesterase [Polyangiales bacterium]|nr:chemotaxis response regulator protein-glutamate methylesterase [Polyangiales bacterium]